MITQELIDQVRNLSEAEKAILQKILSLDSDTLVVVGQSHSDLKLPKRNDVFDNPVIIENVNRISDINMNVGKKRYNRKSKFR